MPTPFLIVIAILMLVIQIAVNALTTPFLRTVFFTIAINLFLSGLYYAAVTRETKKAIFLPELSVSTMVGLKATLKTSLMCIGLFFLLEGMFWPVLFGDPAPANWDVATRVWPTFVFLDATALLYQRWRTSRNPERQVEEVPL